MAREQILLESLKKIASMCDPYSTPMDELISNTANRAIAAYEQGGDGWISVEDQFPDTEHGESIWILYERDGKPVVEVGYVCGENLIKGISERYPYPTHWQPYNIPEPPSLINKQEEK